MNQYINTLPINIQNEILKDLQKLSYFNELNVDEIWSDRLKNILDLDYDSGLTSEKYSKLLSA